MYDIFTITQIKKWIEEIRITRKINEIHIHHTFRPDHKDWETRPDGNYWQKSMYNFHTKTLGWSDIGQHITALPDGKFVMGRDLNKDPASIEGRNKGAIAIEMLGNFDTEYLDGVQKDSVVELVRFLVDRFNAPVIFHREYSTKTCPGSNIRKTYFLEWVDHARLKDRMIQIKQIVEGV